MRRDQFKSEVDPGPRESALQEYIGKLEDENSRLKREVGTDQKLFDYIKEGIVSFPRPDPIRYPKPKLSHADLSAVLVITDAHAEEYVSKEEMEGFASYDWKTFLARMNQTAEKTIELTNIMRQASAVESIDIFSLGDWFCGKIQPQEESYGVTMPMPVAVPSVGQAFGRFLAGISAHFKEIRVHGMCGNHGREGKKPVTKMTADRNWDMSVYLIAQGYTEQVKNIKWDIPHSIMHVVNVAGWNCLITHSGEVVMNNRVPYYPIESTFDMEHKVRSGTPKDFKLVFTGHWHHHAMLDGSIIMCPSMIGANQFSRFKLHRKSAPEQLLCFFTTKHGLVSQWPIKLG